MRSTVTPEPDPANPPLEDLLLQYQQANPDAAAAFIDALSPALFRFFASQMGDRNDAEDMLQDAWLRIHRVRHTYRPGEPVLPWVFAIARRVRIDRYRKRRRIETREMAVDVLPEPAAVPPPTNAELPAFEEMMATLPQSQREVVTLLKVNGLSLEDVARATSSSVGAVKQKAHRAYEKLRTLLRKAE